MKKRKLFVLFGMFGDGKNSSGDGKAPRRLRACSL